VEGTIPAGLEVRSCIAKRMCASLQQPLQIFQCPPQPRHPHAAAQAPCALLRSLVAQILMPMPHMPAFLLVHPSLEQQQLPRTAARRSVVHRQQLSAPCTYTASGRQMLPRSQGTWYRNGPGTFEMGGQPMHVFDGHGLVGRIAFSGGRAHFASRFVRTPVSCLWLQLRAVVAKLSKLQDVEDIGDSSSGAAEPHRLSCPVGLSIGV
jgi:Retinal pigment epithelial membrane protein